MEWCFDVFEADRTKIKSIEDLPTTQPLKNEGNRVLRGRVRQSASQPPLRDPHPHSAGHA